MPKTPEEPSSVGEDPSIGALLDQAEDIVNAAGPQMMADIEHERLLAENRPRGWRRLFRRKG